ncbi:hypothetical protein FVE85_6823 [Porphyridium purpureum]|uniref:Nudix hydrolase domain-containing protein n=1 Tax=Porphyridium purpureum TaxID=35688 RepID=A0A5J4Z7U7_PORPP|nr:hypothetical protein FVE85_6823 [Porphyridium purpureum]|eukprot:POR2125..scf295_1
MGTLAARRNGSSLWPILVGVLSGAATFVLLYVTTATTPGTAAWHSGSFGGDSWRTPNTLDVALVAQTEFARVERHTVRLPDGAVVNDWLWLDELPHVNVLVRSRDPPHDFLLFEQMKYGLDRPALAVLGGLINASAGESPREAAKRELLEELGLAVDDEDLRSLGSPRGHRVMVSRGGGLVYMFYARGAYAAAGKEALTATDVELRAGSARLRKLSSRELKRACLSGSIAESQWIATAALALLLEDPSG